MNKCNRTFIIFLGVFIFHISAFTQDSGLNLVKGLPNSYINPAFDSEDVLFIGLGSKLYNLGNEAFTLKDVFEDGPEGKVLTLSNVVNQVDDRNLARFNEEFKTLEIGYKYKNTIFYGGHGWKLDASLSYRKDLVKALAYGNAPFLDETLNIGSSVNYNSYNETYLGLSTGNEKFRFGLRAKVLNGVQNLSTGKEKIDITTKEEYYQLEIDADYELYSSNTLMYQSLDDYDVSLERFSMKNYFKSNWGWGLDIGLSTTLGPIEVFMSGLDIGRIKYNEKSARYFNNEKNTFDGVDILDFINTEESLSFEDSIKSLIQLKEDSTSYTVNLNGKIVIGGKYHLNKTYQLGAVLTRTSYGIDHAYSLMINGQRRIGKYITLGLSWTYRDHSFANFGGLIVGEYGPVHVYATAHNTIGGILPEDFKSVSIRFGAMLSFNRLTKNKDVISDI